LVKIYLSVGILRIARPVSPQDTQRPPQTLDPRDSPRCQGSHLVSRVSSFCLTHLEGLPGPAHLYSPKILTPRKGKGKINPAANREREKAWKSSNQTAANVADLPPDGAGEGETRGSAFPGRMLRRRWITCIKEPGRRATPGAPGVKFKPAGAFKAAVNAFRSATAIRMGRGIASARLAL